MRRIAMLAGLALALLPSGPGVAADEPVRTLRQEVSLEGATATQVKLPVGDLAVTGTSRGDVSIVVEVRCSRSDRARCKDHADGIAVESRRDGDWLVLVVEGFPRLGGGGLSADVRVEVPARLRFQADLGVGDVKLAALENDVEVDVGVGDVAADLSAARVRAVELDTGVGDAVLAVDGGRVTGAGLVAKGLDWSQGKGTALVNVNTGVGDISIDLR
jgi:hypothetical protein